MRFRPAAASSEGKGLRMLEDDAQKVHNAGAFGTVVSHSFFNFALTEAYSTMNNAHFTPDDYRERQIIEVVPEYISSSTSLKGAYMIILKDKVTYRSERHIPLLMEKADFNALQKIMDDGDDNVMNILDKTIKMFDIEPKSVVIECARTGRLYAVVEFYRTDDGQFCESRRLHVSAPQGVALAMRLGTPIYIDRELFEALHKTQVRKGQVAVPISSMSNDLLEQALRLAVDNEQFELASKLRDEINERNKQDDAETDFFF